MPRSTAPATLLYRVTLTLKCFKSDSRLRVVTSASLCLAIASCKLQWQRCWQLPELTARQLANPVAVFAVGPLLPSPRPPSFPLTAEPQQQTDDSLVVVTLLAAVGGRLQVPASQDTAGLTSALCALRDSATQDVVAVEVLWSPQVGHMLRLCQVKCTRHYHC